jgi:hypothetical protein
LPISFFKNHLIKSGDWNEVNQFKSSATSGMSRSTHLLKDEAWYVTQAISSFESFFGQINGYCILALLPNYLEQGNSSLIFMVESFINRSGHNGSGFYLGNDDQLLNRIKLNQKNNQPTIIIGVTFALLDFVEHHDLNWPDLVVMETGGMKGRRKELTRAAVHENLNQGFGTSQIASEYGMTELLSQAYSKGNGILMPAPTMKVQAYDISDPLSTVSVGQSGCLSFIDLANVHTCSFIASDDIGKIHNNGDFEVLGRKDHSDIRGCSLMVIE